MSVKTGVGRVAIVTGAGNGIGFEIANRLIKSGARVVLNDCDEALARSACQAIDPSGSVCLPLAGDASDVSFIERLVQMAVDSFGQLDMAVANAGLTRFNSVLEIEVAELQSMLDLNLRGSVFLAKFAARLMVKQGNGGRILFLSSVTGHQAHPNVVCYGMTKAALQMLAKGLVVELSGHGITTNAISPGATATERTIEGDPNYAEKWGKTTPMGRVTTPADIASTALFLLGSEAAQITGQTIVVDGGWTAVSPVPDFSGESHCEGA